MRFKFLIDTGSKNKNQNKHEQNNNANRVKDWLNYGNIDM